MIGGRPRLPLVGDLAYGQIEWGKAKNKTLSQKENQVPACGLGAPPVGRSRTIKKLIRRRGLNSVASQCAMGASGSQRAMGASGSQRAIDASGSQRAIGASGQWRAGGTKNHPRRNPKLGASSSLPRRSGATFPNGSTAGRFVLKSNQKGGPANRRLYSCSSGSFFDENMLAASGVHLLLAPCRVNTRLPFRDDRYC